MANSIAKGYTLLNPFQEGTSIILYGAGRYAEVVLRKLSMMKVDPVCFCDTNSKRWGTVYFGFPVMSLEQAIHEYPDYSIVISVAPTLGPEIYRQLVDNQGVPSERIAYFQRKSCHALETTLVSLIGFNGDESLMFCCGGANENQPIRIPYEGDVQEMVATFIRIRNQLIIDNQKPDKTTMCTGCRLLVSGAWLYPNAHLDTIVLADEFSPCQCSCIYCRQAIQEQLTPRPRHQAGTGISHFPELMSYLRSNKLIGPDVKYSIAPAEITVHPQRKAILDAVAIATAPVEILTNGIVFDPRVAELVAIPGNSMLLSLDAGTRETYACVKGIDAFERVTANIICYQQWGTERNVILKYIMLPENKGDEDLAGFVQFAVDAEIANIRISFDESVPRENIDPEIEGAVAKLAGMARANGIITVAPPSSKELKL